MLELVHGSGVNPHLRGSCGKVRGGVARGLIAFAIYRTASPFLVPAI